MHKLQELQYISFFTVSIILIDNGEHLNSLIQPSWQASQHLHSVTAFNFTFFSYLLTLGQLLTNTGLLDLPSASMVGSYTDCLTIPLTLSDPRLYNNSSTTFVGPYRVASLSLSIISHLLLRMAAARQVVGAGRRWRRIRGQPVRHRRRVRLWGQEARRVRRFGGGAVISG
jgi:hypothetical protein